MLRAAASSWARRRRRSRASSPRGRRRVTPSASARAPTPWSWRCARPAWRRATRWSPAPFTFFATVEAIVLAGAQPVFADIEPERLRHRSRAAWRRRSRRARRRSCRCTCSAAARTCRGSRRSRRRAASRWSRTPPRPSARRARPPRRAPGAAPAASASIPPRTSAGSATAAGHHRRSAGRRTRAPAAHPRRARTAPTRCWESPPGSTRSRRRRCAPSSPTWRVGRRRGSATLASMRRRSRAARGSRSPGAGADETPVWNHYTIRCRRAPGVRAALEAEGIEWRHYYPMPAASQPALGAARCAPGSFPEAERACAEALSIPVRPSCAPATIEHIAEVVRRAAVAYRCSRLRSAAPAARPPAEEYARVAHSQRRALRAACRSPNFGGGR